MIDIDGKISYSKTLQVVNKTAGNSGISIFPSLVKNNATISIPSDGDRKAAIIFFDNQGRLVNKIEAELLKGTNNIPVNTTGFLPGKYYIKVISGERKNNTVVMIKQ